MPIRDLADKLNTNPSIRSLKNGRNLVVDTYFRSRGRAEGEAFAARLRSDSIGQACFTVAFNAPWVIDILTAAWEKYCRSFSLVVIDNSSKASSREANRRICEARSVPYFGLPSNPEWSPNRSHGISMNWIYHNIILKQRPEAFGFIDHDCFPYKPFDIAARLAGKSVYGLRKASRKRADAWNLWAGYSFFRFADTLAQPLDFKHRIEFGLDTGGGNWERLYRGMDEDKVATATFEEVELAIGGSVFRHKLIEGAFIHLVGASYRDHFTGGDLRERVAEQIWQDYLPGCSPVLTR